MKIWLVTTGSSDVQLKTADDWNAWYPAIKRDCYNLPFKPVHVEKRPYRIVPRVLGMTYQARPDEIWDVLEFPLLKEFTTKLKNETIDQIVLLLTDQSHIFGELRGEPICPYWQDTRELQPVFERYFQQYFPNTEVVVKVLAPQENGLDDWNFVLDLVRSNLKEISDEPTTVYVSHQAGTPAISSAVQFASLSRFGNRVKFLVSNEYNQDLTEILPSSNYLIALRKQQAEKLLERHDYSAVKNIFSEYLNDQDNLLLDAVIQWNFAEFDKFKEKLKDHPQFTTMVEERTTKENWWWIAYEAAYLGVVRLEQENTVEAMFHSFRALEGLVSKWAVDFYPDDIEDRDGMPVVTQTTSSKLPTFLLHELEKLRSDNPDKTHEIKLYGKKLFTLLQETKPQLKDDDDIKTLCKSASNHRNHLFHRLKGMDQQMLFKAWGMNSRDSWEKRILRCLNLISDQSQFRSLTKASLMAKVHQKLEEAIDQL